MRTRRNTRFSRVFRTSIVTHPGPFSALSHSFTFYLLSCRIDAGKVELDGASYAGLSLPFSITQLIWIEVLAVGYAEFARNAELDPERRLYPGACDAAHEAPHGA